MHTEPRDAVGKLANCLGRQVVDGLGATPCGVDRFNSDVRAIQGK